MLQQMVNKDKNNWHTMLFSSLWDYHTSSKIVTGFTPFQLVYREKAMLSIECEIPSLKLVIEILPNNSIEEE